MRPRRAVFACSRASICSGVGGFGLNKDFNILGPLLVVSVALKCAQKEIEQICKRKATLKRYQCQQVVMNTIGILNKLAMIARRAFFTIFQVLVLPSNFPMQRVLSEMIGNVTPYFR
jgi:hypothetical protein